MADLWIRTRANGVVINHVGAEGERVVEGEVMPVADVAVPRCGYDPPCLTVPDFTVFGVPASAGADIGEQRVLLRYIQRPGGAVVDTVKAIRGG